MSVIGYSLIYFFLCGVFNCNGPIILFFCSIGVSSEVVAIAVTIPLVLLFVVVAIVVAIVVALLITKNRTTSKNKTPYEESIAIKNMKNFN